ncbi:MAG: DUF4032 domain-containing protein [Bowdeniella nasicola]|nr:DUF4032 domain-containing protein [Bowdeniella nasicola]
MAASLRITAANLDPALLDLPWEVALEDWPTSVLAALPRGISRHTVRFARLSGRVVAVKEIGESVAYSEYEMLRRLQRLEAPSVTPIAVITGRHTPNGEELTPALVTQHLSYSLPYRALFSRAMRDETGARLIDALAVLLVRLHTLGFYWGDVSLSNALFRRDAGAFAAYLVDAETGDMHPALTVGQRSYDVDLARTNIIGELMDLQAGGVLDDTEDIIAIGNRLVDRYQTLWDELTAQESFDASERWRVAARVNRLNDLGYDVDELALTASPDGTRLSIQPKVVDAGHYHRQIMRLTGLDVQENQGRRMLNDMEYYRVSTGQQNLPLEMVAHEWMAEVFEPTVRAIPPELASKLEPAEIFHEVLEHRWYMSEQQQRDVPTVEAAASYAATVLPARADEETVFEDPTPSEALDPITWE